MAVQVGGLAADAVSVTGALEDIGARRRKFDSRLSRALSELRSTGFTDISDAAVVGRLLLVVFGAL